MALVQVMLSLTDAAPKPKKRMELTKVWLPEDQGSVLRAPAGSRRARASPRRWNSAARHHKGGDLLRDPALAAIIAQEGSEITRELAIALSLADDPPTAFKGPLGVSKRCAWAEPLPLEEVKAIGKILRCTVNDVLLACAAGALRSYLRRASAKTSTA